MPKDPQLAAAAATLAAALASWRENVWAASSDFAGQEKALASYYRWALDIVAAEHAGEEPPKSSRVSLSDGPGA